MKNKIIILLLLLLNVLITSSISLKSFLLSEYDLGRKLYDNIKNSALSISSSISSSISTSPSSSSSSSSSHQNLVL